MPPGTRELRCAEQAEVCFSKLLSVASSMKGEDEAVLVARKAWGLRLRVHRRHKDRRLGEAVLDIHSRRSEAGTVLELISRRYPGTLATTAVVSLAGVFSVVGLRAAYDLGTVASVSLVGLGVALAWVANAITGAVDDEDDWERLQRFVTGCVTVLPADRDR
jgi:hypothetical protein